MRLISRPLLLHLEVIRWLQKLRERRGEQPDGISRIYSLSERILTGGVTGIAQQDNWFILLRDRIYVKSFNLNLYEKHKPLTECYARIMQTIIISFCSKMSSDAEVVARWRRIFTLELNNEGKRYLEIFRRTINQPTERTIYVWLWSIQICSLSFFFFLFNVVIG